jgi:putative RNA 2'-phosphotransferase
MDKKREVRISKFLSLVLRHAPEKIGLELTEGGWTEVDRLLDAMAARAFRITREELDFVVAHNAKKRFAFSEDGLRIRASQGHSLDVDLGYRAQSPPEVLFHGTAERNVDSILASGLDRRARHHVHLSADRETAIAVGRRHGRPIVFEVSAARMCAEGYEFYVSANGVWLVAEVPPQYLAILR